MFKPCWAVIIVLFCSSPVIAAGSFDQQHTLQGISFHITCPNSGSINELSIIPSGLEIDNRIIKKEIRGTVTGAEVADINTDGSPEIYVYVTSAGNGSYGDLVAFSANRKKSISGIYLPPLADDPVNFKGYMGHDEFTVIENSLARRFPIFKDGDTQANPTGGMRQLQYKLVAGEASWQLKLVNSTSF